MLEQALNFPNVVRGPSLNSLGLTCTRGIVKRPALRCGELRRLGFGAFAGWADASIAHVEGDRDRALNGIREASLDASIMHRSARDACRAIVLADFGDTAPRPRNPQFWCLGRPAGRQTWTPWLEDRLGCHAAIIFRRHEGRTFDNVPV